MLNQRKGVSPATEAARQGSSSSKAYNEYYYDEEDEEGDNDYIDHEEMIKNAYFSNNKK